MSWEESSRGLACQEPGEEALREEPQQCPLLPGVMQERGYGRAIKQDKK